MSGTNSIPASQIVSITPSVLSAGGVGLDLVGLVLTNATQVPVGEVLSFPDQASVAAFFGSNSQEAGLARTYFLSYDTSSMKPGQMLFTQYNQQPVGAWSRGATLAGMTISQLQAIPAGTFTVMIDGVSTTSGTVSLASATSFTVAGQLMSNALAGLYGPNTASFTGVLATGTLTVSAIAAGGTIKIGDQVEGAGIATPTYVVSQSAGNTGGNGVYQTSGTLTVASEPMTTQTPVVHYDPVSQAFVTVSATTGQASSSIEAPTGPIAVALHMDQPSGAITSQGADPAVPAAFMDGVVAYTENWASFMTAFDPDGGTGNAVKQEFAAWVNGTVDNYLYVAWDADPAPTQTQNASQSLGAILAASNSSGTAPIWSALQGPTQAAFIMGCVASFDYTMFNGRTTVAFRQQTGLGADVTNGVVAKNLEANGYLYYGSWKTANDQFTFAYPGNVSGPFAWIDSYVNSIWLTNQFQLALMVLLMNTRSIPYNDAGYTLIKAGCMDVIIQAGNFGVYRSGVTLSQAQAAEVNGQAGANIAPILFAQGWYLKVWDANPQVRAVRGSPPITFWFMDGQSVQRIHLNSVNIQ
ncbi:MAG TPA: DUF3383 domain-containing protein [Mycobacterium sp.]|jgi:hypothetical protein